MADLLTTTPPLSRSGIFKQYRKFAGGHVLDEARAMHKTDAIMVWGPIERKNPEKGSVNKGLFGMWVYSGLQQNCTKSLSLFSPARSLTEHIICVCVGALACLCLSPARSLTEHTICVYAGALSCLCSTIAKVSIVLVCIEFGHLRLGNRGDVQ